MKPRRKHLTSPILEPIQPNAAGIDAGATVIYVAIPVDRDPQPVRCFLSFTDDLQALADWLQKCGVQTVAMESTGVYWIPLSRSGSARNTSVLSEYSSCEACAWAQESAKPRTNFFPQYFPVLPSDSRPS